MRRQSIRRWTVGGVVAVLGCLALIMFLMKDDEASGTYFRHRQALRACEAFVRAELLEPPIAVFPDLSAGGDTKLSGEGDGPFRVESTVEWENEPGALVRSRFVCVVMHVGDDTYELESLHIDHGRSQTT